MTLTYIATNKPEGLKVKNKIGILDNSALKMHVYVHLISPKQEKACLFIEQPKINKNFQHDQIIIYRYEYTFHIHTT